MKNAIHVTRLAGCALALSLMAIGPALAQASAPAGGKPASAAGGPPAASLPHDLRTQHLRLRAVCNQQIEQQGLKGEDAKVYLHKCLLGG